MAQSKATEWDFDSVPFRFRIRERGHWGDIQTGETTVANARMLREQCAGRTFENTSPGQMLFLGVTGTLSQQYASGAE